MLELLGGLFGLLGNGVKGFFGMKSEQASVVTASLEVLKDVNATDASKAQAVASMYAADATSTSWLTRSWRPLCMLGFMSIILSWWFGGYIPPHFNDPMTPMMQEVWECFKWLMGIGIGSRSLDKLMQSLTMSGVLKKFIGRGL